MTTIAANGVNATGLNARGVLQLTPGTPVADDPLTTGSDALRTVNTTGGDFNPERIQIDDDSGVLAGFVSPAVNPGAHLQSVTGVVSYNFGKLRGDRDAGLWRRAGQHAGEGDDEPDRHRQQADGRELQRREPRPSRSGARASRPSPARSSTASSRRTSSRCRRSRTTTAPTNSATTSASLTLQNLVDAINSAAAARRRVRVHRQSVHRR